MVSQRYSQARLLMQRKNSDPTAISFEDFRMIKEEMVHTVNKGGVYRRLKSKLSIAAFTRDR